MFDWRADRSLKPNAAEMRSAGTLLPVDRLAPLVGCGASTSGGRATDAPRDVAWNTRAEKKGKPSEYDL